MVGFTADEFFSEPGWVCTADSSPESRAAVAPRQGIVSPNGAYTAMILERSCWAQDRRIRTVLLARSPVKFPLSRGSVALHGMFWNTALSAVWLSDTDLQIGCSDLGTQDVPHTVEWDGGIGKHPFETVHLTYTVKCAWLEH